MVTAPLAPHNIDFARWQAWICCLAAVITLFLLQNLVTSRVGRAFRAVRDDEIAASLAGLSVPRIQILAFVVSAATAGLAGGLLAIVNGQVGPQSFALVLSLYLLAGAVFGGLGSLAGAAYGAVLITFLPNWSTDVANALSLPSKVQINLPIWSSTGSRSSSRCWHFPLVCRDCCVRFWRGCRGPGSRTPDVNGA